MRSGIFVFAVFAMSPLAIACQKSAADVQARANAAQEQANREIGRANLQATEAQRRADRTIVAAEADFIKMREDYRVEARSDLASIDTRIAQLETRVAAAPAARPDLTAVLPALHAQRDVFANDIRTIDVTSSATFDGTKARLEGEWAELKGLVDMAK